MRTYYIVIISGLLVVFALLFFPTIHLNVGTYVDKTDWLPLTAFGATLIPYAFLGFVVYAIYKLAKS